MKLDPRVKANTSWILVSRSRRRELKSIIVAASCDRIIKVEMKPMISKNNLIICIAGHRSKVVLALREARGQ